MAELKNGNFAERPTCETPMTTHNRTPIEAEFRKHLKASGVKSETRWRYMLIVRRFLKHIGDTRLERLSEDLTRSFFDGSKGKDRKNSATAVSQFLTFAMARLPVPVNARGAESPRAAAPTKKELALRQKWTLDKLVEQKESDDDLIAKLARKLIDHYLYFQGRIKGEPENLDDVVRFADECRELIESNLPLFMGLSAQGRNVHSKIDERVQK